MSAINDADLPPDVRKKLGLPNARKPRTTQRTGPYQPGSSWSCAVCEEHFTQWAKAERHGQQTGHIRLELALISQPPIERTLR